MTPPAPRGRETRAPRWQAESASLWGERDRQTEPRSSRSSHSSHSSRLSSSIAAAGQEAVLVAARQEVSGLRDVFVAIQDALEAALERLEGLESQLVGEEPGGAPSGPEYLDGANGMPDGRPTQAAGWPDGEPAGRVPAGCPHPG